MKIKKQQKIKNFEKYKGDLNNFSIEKVLQLMSHRKQVLFKRLVKEYDLSDKIFPGIFNIQMEDYQYIHTPVLYGNYYSSIKLFGTVTGKKQLINKFV